ncbi:MAG TPA: hypothetical protein VNK41_09200 [Vicinamibacterales bacterium]|nr:hypothetical protein [Vicinamibacterales bacterium]
MARPSPAAIRGHAFTLVAVAAATAGALIVGAGSQIFDSNFVFLWEATALLAGDRPYRDFFEWGAPLPAYLSASAQVLAGHRLIGEFALQWAFIIGGVVLAFHLGIRSSRSVLAPLATLPIVVLLVSDAPTYHYPKLFCVPFSIWLAWRYLDRPGAHRAAVLGAGAALVFFFRHDLGVYAAGAAGLALAFGAMRQGSDARRAVPVHAAVCAAGAVVLLAPWAVVVHRGEGLVPYFRLRTAKYEGTFAQAYRSLRDLNPLSTFAPESPAPTTGIVTFVWQQNVDAVQQRRLEREYNLRAVDRGTPSQGSRAYEAANIYDPRLLELEPYISDPSGFPWERLRAVSRSLPSRERAVVWIQQMAVIAPLALLLSAAVRWRRDADGGTVALQIALAGLTLMAATAGLLRTPAYVGSLGPVIAPLAAPLLAWSTPRSRSRALVRPAPAFVLLALTTWAAVIWVGTLTTRRSLDDWRQETAHSISAAFRRLLVTPPIEASGSPTLRYLRECTADTDRVLVSGMTPFDVSYFVGRPVAGGHLYWKDAWGADPVYEGRSLALLRRQSVPFAIANRRPVLEDFEPYPRIRAYLEQHYRELPGSQGFILFDRRRPVVRRYGVEGHPCFA